MTAQPSPHFSGLPIDLNHTLPQIIDHVAALWGDKRCVVGEAGESISFAGFRGRVRSICASLLEIGIKSGDRLAVWAPNSAQWMIAASAIECIGAILVPINTRFKGPEAAYLLAKTRASSGRSMSTQSMPSQKPAV